MKISLLMVCLIFFYAAFSQRVQISYADRAGNVSQKHSCFTYMVEKSSYNHVDSIVSYYRQNDKPQAIVQVNKQGQLNGYTTEFSENGKPIMRGKFDKGIVIDTLTEWYPNGLKQHQMYYWTVKYPVEKVVNHWDSTGVQLVKNGEGFCNCFFKLDGRFTIRAIGRVWNSKRDSLWMSYNLEGKKIRQQWFKNGILQYNNEREEASSVVRGISLGPATPGPVYSMVEKSAAPEEGMDAFYRIIGENIIFPLQAKSGAIEGKVLVKFIVDVDGSLHDFKVLRGIGGRCDEEALRVVKLSPRWIPAKHQGKTVKQKIVVPISFRLG